MREGLKDDISKVVEGELAAAIENFPMYHSAHEGYAVLKEEVEEAEQELEVIKARLTNLWSCTKMNVVPKETINDLAKFAQLLACEATQIAAVAQKFVKSSEGWK